MDTVTLSPKFRVVIPQASCKELQLTPGDKIRVMRYGDRIELIPARKVKELRGLLRGMDTTVEREGERL